MSNKELAFTVVYDSETGEVVTHGFGIDEAIEVRKGMVDEAVRHAAIVELEKLGYRVLPPGQRRDSDIANTVRALADDLLASFDDVDIDIDEVYGWLIIQAAQIEDQS